MTIVKIPIKPHLRKYIARKLDAPNFLVKVSTTDRIGLGLFIMRSLCKKQVYINPFIEPKEFKFLSSIPENSTLDFEVGHKYSELYGLFISQSRIYEINKFIDNFFTNEMFAFIQSLILHDPTIIVKYALDDFISIYDISDEDIQLESLCKTFSRYKDEYSYIK
ncbi:MAG: hypothetical protein WCK02_16085 [Bacteroidota bacterium]